MASGFQADELHVEGEGGVGWNDTWMPFAAVGVVWRAGEFGPLAHAHLWRRSEVKYRLRTHTPGNLEPRVPHLSDSFFPAADDLLVSDLKPKGFPPRPRRVEHLPVRQGACGRTTLFQSIICNDFLLRLFVFFFLVGYLVSVACVLLLVNNFNVHFASVVIYI